jgi:hypothetical protein
MVNSLMEALTSVALLIIGVAFIAVLVSKNSDTAGVLQAYFSGNANLLGVAESPVTGANIQYTTAYPDSGMAGLGGSSGMEAMPVT